MAMTVHLREPVALGVTRLLEGEAFSGQNHDPRIDKAWVNFTAASGTAPGEHDSLSTDYFLESGTVTTTALESDRGSADFVLRFRPNPAYENLLRSLGLWYDWLEFKGSCTTVLIRQSFCEE